MARKRKPSATPAPPRSRTRPPDAAWYFQRLRETYPDARCALHHDNAWQLLVATILSAQCTDARVNLVTPAFFARWPDPAAVARADRSAIEEVIRSTGFYRNKAKSIHETCRLLVERFGGRVPDTMDELLTLPGVARKTANVVLGNAFGKNDGVVVDTHVQRLAGRLGLSRRKQPEKIERDLMALFPRPQWALVAHLLIFHGRQVCGARRPDCPRCPLAERCPKLRLPRPRTQP